MNYYRIKQVDYDGQYSYSDVTSATYEPSGETIIYPNPVNTNVVTISTPEAAVVTISDVYGRIVETQSVDVGKNEINMQHMPSGFYIFTLGNGERNKILKE